MKTADLRRFFLRFLVSIAGFLASPAASAEISIAELSNRLLEPTHDLAHLLINCAMVLGVGLLVGSVVQYQAHRQNPNGVRLSTPVTFLILGIVLVSLPTLTHYSAGALYVGY